MNADLQGNINMHDPEAGKAPVFMPPPMPPQYPASQPQASQQPAQRQRLPNEWRNLNTLDEPVCETIVKDLLMLILSKIEEGSRKNLAQAPHRDQSAHPHLQRGPQT